MDKNYLKSNPDPVAIKKNRDSSLKKKNDNWIDASTMFTCIDEHVLAGVEHPYLLSRQHDVPHRLPARAHHGDTEERQIEAFSL